MKITVQIKVSPHAIVTAEGESVKEVHEALAAAAEVYAEATCGQCQGGRVVPNHRVAEKFHYYEMRCLDCGARLALGQASDGTLYPKRLLGPDGLPVKAGDATGRLDERHRGWHYYRRPAGPPAPPPRAVSG